MNYNFQKTTKKILSVLTVVALSFAFTSCKDDPLNLNFDTTVTDRIVVHINQGQETINKDVIFSLENDDTRKYLDKISAVTITKLTYKIIDFSGDADGTVSGNLVADTDIVLGTENFDVKNAFDAQTEYEVTDLEAISRMATALKDNHKVTVAIVGESIAENDSMDFKIEITADLNITASAL